MDLAIVLVVLALSAFAVLVTLAAFARFIDPETWRTESGWARRRRTAAVIDAVGFSWLSPLHGLIVWLVVTGVVLVFLALPAVFYLLSRVF